MRKYLLITVLVCITGMTAVAQHKFHGKIANDKLEPLALASVQIKNTRIAALSKTDGSFELELYNGVYEFVVSMVGYKPYTGTVTMNNGDYEQNIVLEYGAKDLGNVTVHSLSRDRAEEYIKKVIRNKEDIVTAAGAYSMDVYIRANREDSLASFKRKKKNLPRADTVKANADLQRMSLAEVYMTVDYQPPGKIKETRTGVTRRGNTSSLFYLSTVDGRFNIYDNLIKLPAVSTTPFVSPISYSGLIAYKFKTIKTERSGNHNIYTIAVRPTAVSNATMHGEIMIDDSAWVVTRCTFTLPKYHLPEYDYFEVQQIYDYVNGRAWLVTAETFTYFSKNNKGKASGQTLARYKNFQLDKHFPVRYFGPEKSSAADSAYHRDSTFWNTVRSSPLTEKEIRFIRYKDSIYAYTHTKAYLDSLDGVANKVTWKKILYNGQPLNNHEKGTRMVFPSLVGMIDLFKVGGMRIKTPFWYSVQNPVNKKSLSLRTELSYGLLNKDLNGNINIDRVYNTFNRATYRVRLQRDFASVFAGDAWINQLKRVNYYLDNSIGGGWGRELINGLRIDADIKTSLRRSIAHYKTYNFIDTLSEQVGEGEDKPLSFQPYNAFYGTLNVSYTLFQPYVREPRQKVILASQWPTVFATWERGVPGIFNSQVNYDYVEYGVRQTFNIGTLGISNYTIKTGSFMNQQQLGKVDYKYQRRGDPFLFMNPNSAFQALDSTFPVFKRFYEGHYFHEFNGALLNRIPVFKKIGLREVAGAGFLVAPERDLRYVEFMAGIERQFKLPFQFMQKVKLGVYGVSSYANTFSNPIQFKIGITTWDPFGNKWR